MKTLHLTNSWHTTSGGVATFYRALMAEADRRGHEIRLVVPGEHDTVETIGTFGRIYYVQSPPAWLNRSYRIISPSKYLWPGSRVQQILLSERPDLVEICDKYTLNYLGALLRRCLLPSLDFQPTVVGMSCERMDDNFRSYLGALPFAASFCSLYMRWLYFPFFDHHIANSEYTAGELRPAANGQVIPRGTWIRYMGADLSHLSPQRRSNDKRRRLLEKFNAPVDSSLLLYVGRLVPEKNLPLLFDALQQLSMGSSRDFRLLVVGEGIKRTRWERQSSRCAPGRVLFLGHVNDRHTLADLYANCDAFVHPNPREPFGIAPLEAMASGLPLVAPDVGGVTSYANAENAWLVNADTQSFVAAVQAVFENPAEARERTHKALATAQSFRWENVAASFLDLYAELHRATTQPRAALSSAFQSTPLSGWRSTVFHAVSQCVEKTFLLSARIALARHRKESKNIPRPGHQPASP
jgi:alpha-1,6-mannosyltransferase